MGHQKKILFIVSNLHTGGVSKSMTSLLNVIDRNRYDVSLMLTSDKGPLVELLPQDIQIITNPIWRDVTARFDGVKRLARKHPLLSLKSMVRIAVSRFDHSRAGRMIAKMMPPIDEEFDTIVDFNGQHQLYYMVDKLKARKKVTFFHSDYSKWPHYYKADREYYPKVDAIFTVSDTCVNALCQYFPDQTDKIGLMENISVPSVIEQLGSLEAEGIDKTVPAIVTVGHMSEVKGTPLAIEAARLLKQRNVNFKWYFVGNNTNPDKYNKLIEDGGLSDTVIQLGVKVNPYPYMRAATIIVHPSKFEGRSIALDEVKLLCKPTVVTNFSTVGNQFENGINAEIVEMTPEAVANAAQKLLEDEQIRLKYSTYLRQNRSDNSAEIEKLYNIFDD